MRDQESTPLEASIDFHALLADPLRRHVLAHVRDSATETASLEEMANDIQPPDDVDAETLEIRLHHTVLPRLAEAGVVEYDPRSNTVRYRDHSALDRLDGQLGP